MGKKALYDIALGASICLCLAAAVVCGIPGILRFSDETCGELLCGSLPRLAACGTLLLLLLRGDEAFLLKPRAKDFGRALLWSLPCLAVALANFPYAALIRGTAVVVRTDLLGLFLLKCLSIALSEELFFRALLLPFLKGLFASRRRGLLASVLLSSAAFALMHLVNLLFGVGLGATLLQVGYTFLLGGMFAVMLLETKNVWLCTLTHFLFDVGGMLIPDLGKGAFQDPVFWVLTAAAGVLCCVHVLLTLRRIWKAERAGRS